MQIDAKWANAVAKLNLMTINKELEWSPQPPSEALRNESVYEIDLVFTTKYKGRSIRLYSRLNKYSQISDKPELILEFYDEETLGALFRFPKIEGIVDLYHSVKSQVSDIEKILEELLA